LKEVEDGTSVSGSGLLTGRGREIVPGKDQRGSEALSHFSKMAH